MATIEKKTERLELKKQKNELFKLVLKKTDTSLKEFQEIMRDMYVTANFDVLTAEDKKKFPMLSFRK
ncbi:MAG: hypothetical protein LBN93_09600 [Candidatus Symbiothrix sp.]|jgi:hypothetical protein|nr:hypothetical protein [Candidatus Symbiothrix sp.]